MNKDDTYSRNSEELTDTIDSSSVKNYAEKEEIVTELETLFQEEKNLHLRLSYTALKFIRSYFFADTINGITSDDVVQQVLEKIVQCKRRWDKNRFPDLLDFIRICILSYIRNEKKRKDKFEKLDLYDENGDLQEWKYQEYIKVCFEKDLNDNIIDGEQYEILIETLFGALKEDVYATFILEKRLDGTGSNIEIAKELGIDVKDVENALKRIRRKYIELVTKLKE